MSAPDLGSPPVIDGTNGKVIEVDGAPATLVERPEQPALVQVPLEDLVHSLAVAQREARDAKKAAKAAKRGYDECMERVERIVDEIAQRDEPAQADLFGKYDYEGDTDDGPPSEE